jgi:hypothetical protein
MPEIEAIDNAPVTCQRKKLLQIANGRRRENRSRLRSSAGVGSDGTGREICGDVICAPVRVPRGVPANTHTPLGLRQRNNAISRAFDPEKKSGWPSCVDS